MSEQPSILELLERIGVSEADWLIFGKIWREYGSRDPQELCLQPHLMAVSPQTVKRLYKRRNHISKASFRKQDQFISISYFHQFIREINTIIPLDLNCEDSAEVANMEVPTMKFYKDGFKLHRRGKLKMDLSKNRIKTDVALAVVKLTPATKMLTQKDRQTFLYEFEGILLFGTWFKQLTGD